MSMPTRKGGYDEVHYRMTRHDLVPRVANIPHPLAYAQLVDGISSNWSEFAFTEQNSLSAVRPKKRRNDSRVIIRDGYDGDVDEEEDEPLPARLGRRFEVHADISNFYPSIYSHSVPWALAGKAVAKVSRSKTLYYNKVDASLQAVRRGETKGISIGPGTSNIISETILGRIDQGLSKAYEYTRYIDDYTFFAASEEQARSFIYELERELGDFRLSLNPRKTRIDPLPSPSDEPWVNQLRLHAPEPGAVGKYQSYLDLSIALGQDYPDGSTIKYAVRRILTSVGSDDVPAWFADQLAGLAFHRPVLLPLLRSVYESHADLVARHMPLLNSIAIEAATRGRSDALCWTLHFLGEADLVIDSAVVDAVLRGSDPLALILLADLGTEADLKGVIEFATTLDAAHPTDLDRYWLLLHALHLVGKIADPYKDGVMDVLRDENVQFYQARSRLSDP